MFKNKKTKNENQSCWQGPLERRRIFLRSENRPRKTRGYATISRSDAKGHVFKKRTPTAMSSAFSPWRTPCSSEAYPLRMFWRRQSTASTKKRQPHDALASCGCLPLGKLLYRCSPKGPVLLVYFWGKRNTVVWWKASPARRTQEGKLSWLGESG